MFYKLFTLIFFSIFLKEIKAGTICLFEGANYSGSNTCIDFSSNEELCWEVTKCGIDNKASSVKWWTDTNTRFEFFSGAFCRGSSRSWDGTNQPSDFSKDTFINAGNMNDQISSVRIYPYSSAYYFHHRESCSQLSFKNIEGHNFCLYSVTIQRTVFAVCPSTGACNTEQTYSEGNSLVFREQGDCNYFGASTESAFTNMIGEHKNYLASPNNVRIYGQSRTNSAYGEMVIEHKSGQKDYDSAAAGEVFGYLITGGRVSRCTKENKRIHDRKIINAPGFYDVITSTLFGSCT